VLAGVCRQLAERARHEEEIKALQTAYQDQVQSCLASAVKAVSQAC